ncbi:MAG: glutamate formimidoyltransferase [bacterium]|nr:glutamate formimidoyltransferase [bacterium]
MDIIVESVPNISEGRNKELINTIANVIEKSGVNLLDIHFDWDHNRSVFTFIGQTDKIFNTIFNITEFIYDKIDLTKHKGVHPRSGAIDVIPFIPVKNISYQDLTVLVNEFGYKFFERFNIPVYFYGFNATKTNRIKMNKIRNLNFEKLKELLKNNNIDNDLKPDIYKDKLIHEKLGVCFIGVRKPLLAFNVNYLNTYQNENIEKKLNEIAKKIRESSNGIKNVQAKVFFLESKNLFQLSLNILDALNTDFYFIFNKIQEYSNKFNLKIANTEIVGLMPSKTVENIVNNYLINSNFGFKKIIEFQVE